MSSVRNFVFKKIIAMKSTMPSDWIIIIVAAPAPAKPANMAIMDGTPAADSVMVAACFNDRMPEKLEKRVRQSIRDTAPINSILLKRNRIPIRHETSGIRMTLCCRNQRAPAKEARSRPFWM